MKRTIFLSVFLLITLLLSACSGVQLFSPDATATPSTTLSPTATQPTPTPRPTFTFTPSPTRDTSMIYQVISTENVDALTERYRLTEEDYPVVTSLAFSPDGNLLASGGNGEFIRLWSADRGELLASLPGHTGNTQFLTFSPDGSILVSANSDKTIRLWDGATFQSVSILQEHSEYVTCLAFSPDGRWLASGGQDGQVILWDLENQTIGAYLPQEGPVSSVVFSPDGATLASVLADGSFAITLWSVPDFENIKTIAMTDRVSALAFSPDGLTLAAAMQSQADPTVHLVNPQTGKTVRTLSGAHELELNSVTFSPDGSLVVSTSADSSVAIWETRTGQLLTTLTHNNANFVTFSPDGTLLATAGSDNTVRIWSLPLVPAPTATPTVTPDLSTATFVPMSTPGCDSGASRLGIGRYAAVASGMPPIRVRSTPSTAGDVIASLNAGTYGKVVDGPICADGLIFWRIEETSLIPGGSGWVAETNGSAYWLDPYSP